VVVISLLKCEMRAGVGVGVGTFRILSMVRAQRIPSPLRNARRWVGVGNKDPLSHILGEACKGGVVWSGKNPPSLEN